MGLRSILDHFDAAFGRNAADCCHVGRQAVEMDGDYCARMRGDCRFDARRIDIVGALVRLDRNWTRAALGGGKPSGDVGIRGNNLLVTAAYSIRPQNEMQRLQAVTHSYAILGATVRREFALKMLDLFAKDVPT